MRISILLFSFLFCLSCSGSKSIEQLQVRINELMAGYEAIGLSVAVVKDGTICYQEAFGFNPDYLHPDRRDSIGKDDLFRIASISKTFVATAIMQLVEKGLVNLDSDINQYLPFAVRNPRYPQTPITVRMLLSHRSGLTDYQYGKNRNNLEAFATGGKEGLKPFFQEYKPGRKYKYCNIGFNLLGAIIESVSKERFDRYIANHILNPLGIKAGYNVSDLDAAKLVRAYRYNEKQKKFAASPQMYKSIDDKMESYRLGYDAALFSPAGGMKISVPDLAKYMLMHIGCGELDGVRIINKELEEMMWKPVTRRYGLGFMHANFNLKGVDMIGHQGGAYGIHSEMFFSPEGKYGFIVICNGCKGGHQLDSEILRELYHHFIE